VSRPAAAVVLAVAVAVLAAGCGSQAAAPKIERTFDLDWHDRASQVAISYTARNIVFHDGRWSADVTVHNATGKPLYEAVWPLPGPIGSEWDGPALVYSGLDVLGNRRLIYVPADRELPAIPLPLPDGATWHGTISGKVPRKPALPHGSDIWLRYPVFGVGQQFGLVAALDTQWISVKAITL
jgi:hypothetical protein